MQWSRKARSARKPRRISRRPFIEQLEERRLLTITADFYVDDEDTGNGTLNISSDEDLYLGADSNGVVIANGLSQFGNVSNLPAGHVAIINVQGEDGASIINLSGVTRDAFMPGLTTQIEVSGGSPSMMMSQQSMSQGMQSGQDGEGIAIGTPDSPASSFDATSFATLAETLIGPNWADRLGIDDLNAFFQSDAWRSVAASDDISAALDPVRVTQFLQTMLGDSWAQQLQITDLPSTLESGAWRDLLRPASALASDGLDVAMGALQAHGLYYISAFEDGAVPALGSPYWSGMFAEANGGVSETGEAGSFQAMAFGAGGFGGASMLSMNTAPSGCTITGSAFDDTIFGSAGNDTIRGGGGDDFIDPLGGDDIAYGDDGDDQIVDAIVNGAEGDATEAGNDTLYGGAGNDSLDGGEGNDQLYGDTGDDTLIGSGGNDLLDVGPSSGDENSYQSMDGGDGSDTYLFTGTTSLGMIGIIEPATNAITGGHTDTLDFSGLDYGSAPGDLAGVSVDLGSEEGGDTAVDFNGKQLSLDFSQTNQKIENIVGTRYADHLTGNALPNRLEGGAGADYLAGAGGNDTYVFAGDQALGKDTIIEGASEGTSDALNFFGLNYGTGVTVDLSSTSNDYHPIPGDSRLVLDLSAASQMEKVAGTQYADHLSGISGGAKASSLSGGTGDDTYVFAGTASYATTTISESDGGGSDTLDFSALNYGSSPSDAAGINVDLSVANFGDPVINHNGKSLPLNLGTSTWYIENVIGTQYADTLTGNDLDNRLEGGAGADLLVGGEGNDTLVFDQADVATGGPGFDTPEILDNGEPGYSESGTWTNSTAGLGFNHLERVHDSTTGVGTASWTFSSLPTDDYQVLVTWSPSTGATSNAPFNVYNGSTLLNTSFADEGHVPTDVAAFGYLWNSLGTFHVDSGQLVVSLPSLGIGATVADAVRIVRVGAQTPNLAAIPNFETNIGQPVSFVAHATEATGNGHLEFSLAPGAPDGATITADGYFSWTPGTTVAVGVYHVTVQVADSETPTALATATFAITVHKVNHAPILSPIANQIVELGSQLSFSAAAVDPDGPNDHLTFSLAAGGPTGATITSGGTFTWTPASPLTLGLYPIAVLVSDDGSPSLTTSATFFVTVTSPGTPSTPQLAATSDSGISNSDQITNVTTPTFTGTAPTGSHVQILMGSDSIGAGIAANGQYSIVASPALTNGSYTLKAAVVDGDGNVTATSPGTLSLVIDTIAPSIPSTPDLDAGSDTGTSSADNLTNATVLTFAGTADADTIVDIYNDGNFLVSGNVGDAQGAGHYLVTVIGLAAGAHVITARGRDTAGNTSIASAGLNITVVRTPPTALSTPDLVAASDSGSSNSDNVTSETEPTLAGSADSGATIKVYSNGALVGSGVAASGSYSITTSTLLEGTNTIVVSASDAAGNTVYSPSLAVTIDTTAPESPSIPDLAASSDTGPSSTDNLTSDSTPTFTGTAEAGSTVQILSDDVVVGSGVATGGLYTVTTTTTLAGGTHHITAQTIDLAGNTSESSSDLTIVLDVSPPAVPSIPDLTANSDSGSSNTDNLTKLTALTFVGTAEAGVTVRILGNGNVLASGVAVAGNYNIRVTGFTENVYAITAVAVDSVGNASAASSPLSVTVDTTAPATPSVPDLDPGSDTGSSNTDNLTSATALVFNGTASAGTTIQVFAGGQPVGSGVATNGNYSITTSSLVNGTYAITATAADAAGNTSAVSTPPLSVTVDTTAFTARIQHSLAAGPNGTITVGECTLVTLTGLFTDPTNLNTHTFAWSVDNGNLANESSTTGSTFSFVPTDNGSYTVTLTATNSANEHATATLTIVVTNVAPVLSNLAILVDAGGGTGLLTGTISDPSALDTFTLQVDWGDGTNGTYTFAAGTHDFSRQHDFPNQAVPDLGYTAHLIVADKDGGTDTRPVMSISNFVWSDSPSLTGGPAHPATGDLGPTGLSAPTFTGPELDNSAGEAFASAMYDMVAGVITRQYNQAVAAAQATYAAAVLHVSDVEEAAQNAASDAYSQAISAQSSANPVDIAQASAAYGTAVAGFTTTLSSKLDELDHTRQADYAHAGSESLANPSSAQGDIDYAKADYDYSCHAADARKEFDIDVSNAGLIYQTANDAYSAWNTTNSAALLAQKQTAFASAALATARTKADAQQVEDRQIAVAAHLRDVDLATAAYQRDRMIADGLVTAATTLAAQFPGAWSDYQLTAAQHARDHAFSIAEAHFEQDTHDAQAMLDEANELAQQKQQLNYALAAADLQKIQLSTKAERTFAAEKAILDQQDRDQTNSLWNETYVQLAKDRDAWNKATAQCRDDDAVAAAHQNADKFWLSPPQDAEAIAAIDHIYVEAHLNSVKDDHRAKTALDKQTNDEQAVYQNAVHAIDEQAVEDEAELAGAAAKAQAAAGAGRDFARRAAMDRYDRAEATAIANRTVAAANNALTLAIEQATQDESFDIQQANDEANFKNTSMSAYVSALSAWAAAQNTLWASHVVDTVSAEARRIQSEGVASVTFATAQAAIDYQATVVAANAQHVYDVSEADAVSALKSSLVDADIARAGAVRDGQIAQADETADAEINLDKQIARANQGFADALALLWQDTRDQMLDVTLQRQLAYDDLSSNFSVAGDNARASAQQNWCDAMTAIYRTVQNGEASLRADWTEQMEDAKVIAATAKAAAAHGVDADQVADFAQEQAGAVEAYEDAIASYSNSFSLTLAQVDRVAAIAMVGPTRTQSHALALADAQYSLDMTSANNQYNIADADAYLATTSAWASAQGTARAGYLAGIASDEAAYQHQIASYQSALTNAQVATAIAQSDANALADGALAIKTATSNCTFATATADAELVNAVAIASAEYTQAAALGTAEANRHIATLDAAADAQVSDTVANADWAKRETEIQQGWIATVAAATVVNDYWVIDVGGWTLPTNTNSSVVAIANAARDAEQLDNNVDRVEHLADDTRGRVESLGAADVTLADADGQAHVNYVTQVAAAQEVMAASTVTAEESQTVADTTAALTNQLAHIGYEQAAALADAAAQEQFDVGQASVQRTYTVSAASTEATYYTTQGDSVEQNVSQAATALGTTEGQFVASYAAARGDWITSTATYFQTEWQTRAGADYDHAVAEAQAGQNEAIVSALASAQFGVTVAMAGAQQDQSDQLSEAASESPAVVRQGRHDISLATADATMMHGTAMALKEFASTGLEADIIYQLALVESPNNSAHQAAAQTRDDSLMDANVTLATEERTAAVGWASTVATAEATLSIGDALADKALAIAEAADLKQQTFATADAADVRDQSLAAVATLAFNSGITDDSAQETARVGASVDFLQHAHTQEKLLLDALATNSGTPLAQYLAARAHALDGAVTAKTTSLMAQAATAISIDSAQNALIRDAQYGDAVAVSHAQDTEARAKATLDYNRTVALEADDYAYVLGVAPVALTYEVALAQARADFAVAQAEGDEDAQDELTDAQDTANSTFVQDRLDAASGPRLDALTTNYQYALAVSGATGVEDTLQTTDSSDNDAETHTIDDARYQDDVAAANSVYSIATAYATAAATAMASFATSNPSNPWVSVDASIAAVRATSIQTAADSQKTNDLSQALSDMTAADADADALADGDVGQTASDQLSLLNSALAAYNSGVDELTHGQYAPDFTPGELKPLSVDGATSGRVSFIPSVGVHDSFYNYYTAYYSSSPGGWSGLPGWEGYWRDVDGLLSFVSFSGLAPSVDFDWYIADWYLHAPDYGFSGFNGTSMANGSGLSDVETRIAGDAATNTYQLAGLPPSPTDVGFGQGLFNSAAIRDVISAEPTLAHRDKLFAQTSELSFWSDPAHYNPTGAMIGQVDTSLATGSQSATTPQPTFADLTDAAFNEAGEGTLPGADDGGGAGAEFAQGSGDDEGSGDAPMMLNEAEGEEAAAPIRLKLDPNHVPFDAIQAMIKDGTAISFGFNSDGQPFKPSFLSTGPRYNYAVLPNYAINGEFLNYLVFRLVLPQGEDGSAKSYYELVGVDSDKNDTPFSAAQSIGALPDALSNARSTVIILDMLPLTSTAGHILDGNYGRATVSFVGDASLGLGIFGSVAKGGTTAVKAAMVADAASAAGNVGLAAYDLKQGKTGVAVAELGEAFLRLAGLAPSAIQAMKTAAREAKATAKVLDAVEDGGKRTITIHAQHDASDLKRVGDTIEARARTAAHVPDVPESRLAAEATVAGRPLVEDSYDLALGLANHPRKYSGLLENFAEHTGSRTYYDLFGTWGFDDIDQFKSRIVKIMNDARLINVNLDGMATSIDDVPRLVAWGADGPTARIRTKDGVLLPSNYTNWEIYTIETSANLKAKVVYYINGEPIGRK